MIYYSAINFLWHIKIEASVAGFHVKNRHFESLGAVRRKATICIAKDEQGIGL
jgi:hypothetical protein